MTLKPANYKYRRRTTGTSLTGGKEMRLVYAEIELLNEADLILNQHGYLPENKIRRTFSKVLVDSGALDLVITEKVQAQLDLTVIGKRTVNLADETLLDLEIVGPVQIRFENRSTTVRALVLPGAGEILLGAIPMEGLDVLVDPGREKLIVNPKSPDIPMSKLKRVA
jgi:clan AA aspartic protease